MRRLRAIGLILTAVVSAVSLSSCVMLRAGSLVQDVFLGEEDIGLAGESLPALIKASEVLTAADPADQGAAITTASLYLLYGSEYLEGSAFYLQASEYERRTELVRRARNLYKRAFVLLRPFVEKKSPNLLSMEIAIGEAVSSDASGALARELRPFRRGDAPLLYYSAASILAAFSSDPLDFGTAALVPAALAMIEKALDLDPGYGNGSIYELAFQIYVGMPAELGGGMAKAEAALAEAERLSGGTCVSAYVSYALNLCAPAGDLEGYERYLAKALGVMPEQHAHKRLLIVLAQRKARFLLENAEDFVF